MRFTPQFTPRLAKAACMAKQQSLAKEASAVTKVVVTKHPKAAAQEALQTTFVRNDNALKVARLDSREPTRGGKWRGNYLV